MKQEAFVWSAWSIRFSENSLRVFGQTAAGHGPPCYREWIVEEVRR